MASVSTLAKLVKEVIYAWERECVRLGNGIQSAVVDTESVRPVLLPDHDDRTYPRTVGRLHSYGGYVQFGGGVDFRWPLTLQTTSPNLNVWVVGENAQLPAHAF